MNNYPLLKIIPLGGVGAVTKNMYIYEYRKKPNEISDILIVDCGIGFPDESMYGIDLIIPDISYLENKVDKIRGIILTHGHEDHIGALPYVLPKLKVPVYGTKLTAALAEVKLKEFGLHRNVKKISLNNILNIGPFSVETVHVTHSIPDAAIFIIKTPIGTILHASDFKFDWTPIDQKQTEVEKIANAGGKGILCLLSDCVRVETPGYTLSEKEIEESLEKEIKNTKGKFIFTTQSSNISRIQQAINVSVRNGRKIAFLGRSILKTTDVASKLGYLKYPDIFLIKEKEIKRQNPKDVSLIVTGSQAQPNSALVRIADGEHKHVSVKEEDVVVFSADPIPGYESSVHNLIDILTEAGARVAYSEITDKLHVSGHGAQNDLSLMIALSKAKYLMPIGGTFRQMKHYSRLAQKMGYTKNRILIPSDGDVIEFDKSEVVKMNKHIDLKNVMVDGLGIGDIGNVVLRDRQTMANEGIVVVVVPIDQNSGKLTSDPDIISRGFVYMKESVGLIDKSKKIIKNSIKLKKGKLKDWQNVRKNIENNLKKFLYKETHRRPLVLPVIIRV